MKISAIPALTITVLLCACNSDPVYLRNAQTGASAQCGPYAHLFTVDTENVAIREQKCISDLKRQGYEPVAAPAKNEK